MIKQTALEFFKGSLLMRNEYYGSRTMRPIMIASTILAMGPRGTVHSPLIATQTK
jgi:hypothetical protein